MGQLTSEEWNSLEDSEDIIHCTKTGIRGEKKENMNQDIGQTERGSVCREAMKVINGMRQDCYGNPEDSFDRIGFMWTSFDSVMKGTENLPDFAWVCAMKMALMKMCRLVGNQRDRDSYRDAIGYIALACDMAMAEDMEKE